MIVFIVGPTASGKTAVGISLAKKLNGEVVSCDSMQVYQRLNIITNKPSIEEMDGITHHLMDCVAIVKDFDVAQFEQMAKDHIQDILERNKVPIVVGGSGMYMKVLLDGIFQEQAADAAVRARLEQELSEKGCEALHQELQSVDPQSASKIHPNDSRRIIRALEAYHQTGVPISQLQKKTEGLWGRYDIKIFGLTIERVSLYQRIDDRVDQMFEQGLVEEIKGLDGDRVGKTAQGIIGIQEVRQYLNSGCSLEEAKQEMKKKTRRLAKRQLTWFRAEKRLRWIDMTKKTADSAVENILSELRKNAG